MRTKEQKQAIVADLVENIRNASGLYFVDFTGVSVASDRSFRKDLREKGVKMMVAKNTLVLRALAEIGGYEVNAKQLFGQTGVIIASDDPVAPAKIIKQYFDKGEKPKLKVAVIEGVAYNGTQLKQLAELPTREDIIASIVGSLHAPISGIVGTINAVMRDVASLVEEVAKKTAA